MKQYSNFIRKLNENENLQECENLQLDLAIIYKNSLLCNKELKEIINKFNINNNNNKEIQKH